MKTIVIFSPLYTKSDLDICKKYTGNDVKVVFIDAERNEIIEYIVNNEVIYQMFEVYPEYNPNWIESISDYQITNQVGLIFN